MSEEKIHPTAVISPAAQLGENVTIGPYTVVGPHVRIGDNCTIHHHTTLDGHLTLGANNEIFQYCSIGAPPQDLTYKDEPTRVEIGENNVFREYVSIHRGTLKENQVTSLGNNLFLMAYVHVGHDVQIGNNCIMANSVNLAGHVKIGDNCIIGGGTQVSQFVRLGRGSYLGGASGVHRDVPLFCTAYGNRVCLKGINIIGLRRQGYTRDVVSEVVEFYRSMEMSKLSPRAFIDHEEFMDEFKNNEVVQEMAQAIRVSEVGIAPFM